MNERIILSLTSYKERLSGLPITLDSIFAQSVPPDLVVLNLAHGETLTPKVQAYIEEKNIEIHYVEDTKVYKKIIPTLKRYPNDVVICIDDDWIYPQEMIEEFLDMHKRYPNNPISGNHIVEYGMACHCGCASLTKAEYFGDFLHEIDCKELLKHCPCDDIAYTYFSIKSGHPYYRTKNEYFLNLSQNGNGNGYSMEMRKIDGIRESYQYMISRYGELPTFAEQYITDNNIATIIADINLHQILQATENIKNSVRYRIGHAILSPLAWINQLVK